MNTGEIADALRVKYPPPEFSLLFEVRNQTGYSRGTERYADAVCMSLYPHKGIYLSGFEFKVSRQDLMNELQHPEKHATIAKICNYWWLVLGDSKIIKDGELPESWGLMVPRGSNLIIKKHAPLKEVNEIPKHFIASLLRSALRASPAEAALKAAVRRAIDVERKSSIGKTDYEKDRLRNRLANLEQSIESFERTSGIKIDGYNGPVVGETIRFLRDHGGIPGLRSRLNGIKSSLKAINHIIDSTVAELGS